jgi:hypothetical protein
MVTAGPSLMAAPGIALQIPEPATSVTRTLLRLTGLCAVFIVVARDPARPINALSKYPVDVVVLRLAESDRPIRDRVGRVMGRIDHATELDAGCRCADSSAQHCSAATRGLRGQPYQRVRVP